MYEALNVPAAGGFKGIVNLISSSALQHNTEKRRSWYIIMTLPCTHFLKTTPISLKPHP